MPQSSIKAHMRRLFEPEAFHLTIINRVSVGIGLDKPDILSGFHTTNPERIRISCHEFFSF